MKARRHVKRISATHYSNTTIERVAMAMEWQKLPSVERDYARNRARALLDAIAEVTPSGGVSR